MNVTTQIGCYARRSYTRLASAPRVENVKVTCSANGCIELKYVKPLNPIMALTDRKKSREKDDR